LFVTLTEFFAKFVLRRIGCKLGLLVQAQERERTCTLTFAPGRIRVKNMRTTCLALLAGVLLFAGASFAHHGTANYDTTKTISVKGVVTDFQFVNPHVQISVAVKDDTGKAKTWSGELTSPNRLSRAGWSKDSIKVGDIITIGGYPTKSGSPEIWIQKITLSDGSNLATGLGN
jgi:Family of unknown function (DUF6152)